MNKEDINNLKEMLVDFNEYSTDYTKTRCKELEKTVENTLNEIDRLNNINKQLVEECQRLDDEETRLNNIIEEIEKWLEDNLGNCRTNQNYTSNQIYNLKEDAYYRCLDKLKALKEK